MPKHTNQAPPNSENHSDAEVQAMFAEQYFRDEQQHWADSYGEGTDENPPTHGGVVKRDTKPKPKPKPAPKVDA
ncbi:hypothetical protein F4823DRAFT_568503 [Ustulina deusta]|nr:hypothetical protein F4823DRAFT_568503 [Ustulina deusta]